MSRKPSAVDDQHAIIGVAPEKKAKPEGFVSNPHPGAAWFSEGNFGLFIHWGISSVDALVDLSWGMVDATAYDLGVKVTPREYFRQAERFHPDQYDPEKWLRAAAAAGMNHAILTTKHHDGFALWPSDYGDFNTRNFLGGRDLVREYVEACRRVGMKVGLYYSPPDWYFNRERMSFCRASDGSEKVPHLGLDHEVVDLPPADPGWEARFHAYLRGQIEELLTRYGQIDLLFFDGRPEVISLERIRELQPGILVNERMHGHGDYVTPECHLPAEAPAGTWEVVDTWDMAGRWGYVEPFANRPSQWVIQRLCHTRALGGNYMVNVAPRADGCLPDEVYRDLDIIAEWQVRGRESISGVAPLPSRICANVPGTMKGKTAYFFPPRDYFNLIGMRDVPPPESVTLLHDGQPLPYGYMGRFKDGPRFNILLPLDRRSGVDVIKVEFSEAFH